MMWQSRNSFSSQITNITSSQRSKVGGASKQRTDGPNISAADGNSGICSLCPVGNLYMTTRSVLPARRASRRVSCNHLASSWLGPSGRPRLTNQTHHSSSRSGVRLLTPPSVDAPGDETLPETHHSCVFNVFFWSHSAMRHDNILKSRAGGALRVQTCVAAVVNFTPTRCLTLLTTQRHSCEVTAPANNRANGGHVVCWWTKPPERRFPVHRKKWPAVFVLVLNISEATRREEDTLYLPSNSIQTEFSFCICDYFWVFIVTIYVGNKFLILLFYQG